MAALAVEADATAQAEAVTVFDLLAAPETQSPPAAGAAELMSDGALTADDASVMNGGNFELWSDKFEAPADKDTAATTLNVPEPAAAMLAAGLLVLVVVMTLMRRRFDQQSLSASLSSSTPLAGAGAARRPH
ncbi:MAG: hypothetical protein AAF589_02680 [Planctomycetota bacterium]